MKETDIYDWDTNFDISVFESPPDADINDRYGRKPIHIAAQFGLIELLRSQLAQSAEVVNIRDALGRTPLHYVTCQTIRCQNSMGMLELLLEKGADPNLKDPPGFTPLAYACLHSPFSKFPSVAATALLREHGADLEVAVGRPPNAVKLLDILLDGQHWNLRKELVARIRKAYSNRKREQLNHVEINRIYGESEYPFSVQEYQLEVLSPLDADVFRAIEKSDAGMLEQKLKMGANINTSSKNGETPLSLAVGRGELHLIDILISHGADIYVDFEKIIVAASAYGGIATMEHLLQNIIEANFRTKTGENILHLIAIELASVALSDYKSFTGEHMSRVV